MCILDVIMATQTANGVYQYNQPYGKTTLKELVISLFQDWMEAQGRLMMRICKTQNWTTFCN